MANISSTIMKQVRSGRDKPEYQRAMQKYNALNSGQRALLNTEQLDEFFINREIDKYNKYSQLGQRKKALEHKTKIDRGYLDERKRQHDADLEFEQGKFEQRRSLAYGRFGEEQRQAGESSRLGKFGLLLGIGSGLAGFMSDRARLRKLKLYEDMFLSQNEY